MNFARVKTFPGRSRNLNLSCFRNKFPVLNVNILARKGGVLRVPFHKEKPCKVLKVPSVRGVLDISKGKSTGDIVCVLKENFPVLQNYSYDHLVKKVKTMKDRRIKLSKNKKREELDEFLRSDFMCCNSGIDIKKKDLKTLTPRKRSLTTKMEKQKREVKSVKRKLFATAEKLNKENEKCETLLMCMIEQYKSKCLELEEMSLKLIRAKSEIKDNKKLKTFVEELNVRYIEKSVELNQLSAKLSDIKSKYKPRNVHKREARQTEKIQTQQHKIKKLQNDSFIKEKTIENLESELNEAYEHILLIEREKKSETRKKLRLQRKIATYNESIEIENKLDMIEEMKRNDELISELSETIESLKSENRYLEQVNEILKEDTVISTFENGKYTDEIRECAMNLMQMNVSAENTSKVIRTVLEKIGHFQVDRLPSYSLNLRLAVEGRLLSLLDTSCKLLTSDDDLSNPVNVIHNDATSRNKRAYTTTQVSGNTGTKTIALSEVLSESKETLSKVNKQVFRELAYLRSAVFGTSENDEFEKLICSVGATVSDRGSTEIAFNRDFENFRSQYLSKVITDWDNKNEDEKSKLSKVYHSYCFLHVIINMATYAENGLRALDAAVLENFKHPFGLSSTQCAINNAVKSFEKFSDERSGQSLAFSTFLSQRNRTCRFKRLKGNRANILFINGGAYYYHINDMKQFLDIWSKAPPSDLNDKLKSVYNELPNKASQAGARALGILEKLVISPLAKVIESVDNILDMAKYCIELNSAITELSNDSSEILDDPKSLFNYPIVKDEFYDALFKCDDEELNILTIQTLELICKSWLVQFARMLSEFFPGGEFEPENDTQSLRSRLQNVQITNRCAERQFASFDKIQSAKPAAKLLHIESTCIMQQNNVQKQIENMDTEIKENLFEIARKNVCKTINDFKLRQTELLNLRIQKLKDRERENQTKAAKTRTVKSNLCEIIFNMGGEWKSCEQVDENVARLTEKDKRFALINQIKFKKIIIMAEVPKDKSYLFNQSKDGKAFSVTELIEHLKEIIRHNPILETQCDDTDVESSAVNQFNLLPFNQQRQRVGEQKDIFAKKLKKVKESRRS